MIKYDYYQTMAAILDDYLPYYFEKHKIFPKQWEMDELEEELYDNLYNLDNITGNGRGYFETSNQEVAYGRLYGNYDLVADALDGYAMNKREILSCLRDPVFLDVVTRCYILRECLHDYLTNLYSGL